MKETIKTQRLPWWKAIEWAAKNPKKKIYHKQKAYFFNYHTAATTEDVKILLCDYEMHKEYAPTTILRTDMLDNDWFVPIK